MDARSGFHASQRLCSHSVLLTRRDNVTPGGGAPESRAPPWSVLPSSFPLLDPHNGSYCNTPDQLADAVLNGQRERVGGRSDALDSLAGDTKSVFHPHGCSVPHFGPSRACQAMSQFSAIIVYGDSMMRHLTQGMLALLAGDLAHGATPHLPEWPASKQEAVHRLCACDGQFSENDFCRKWQDEDGGQADHPLWFRFTLSRYRFWLQRDSGPTTDLRSICPAASRLTFLGAFRGFKEANFTGQPSEKVWRELLCTGDAGSKASRPLPALLLLQLGVHGASQALKGKGTLGGAFHAYVKPVLHLASSVARKCGRPLIPWWTGQSAQIAHNDRLYPWQASDAVVPFDRQMKRMVTSMFQGDELIAPVRALEFYNLTDGARTDDGYHRLTDVNVAKADVLLHAMELSIRPNLS